MYTRPYSDEFYHYGVKGMKWGVRRYQNYDGTLTAAGKRRKHRGEDGNLELNSDGSYRLKPGVKVQRISDMDESTDRPYTYVTFTKHDNDMYDDFFAKSMRLAQLENPGTEKIYRNNFVTTKELKFPSENQAKDAFIKVFNKNSEEFVWQMGYDRRLADMNFYPMSVGKAFKKFDKNVKTLHDIFSRSSEFYVNRYKGMSLNELKDDAYYDFMNSIANKNRQSLRDAYFSELKSEGFDGVIDDNDRKGLGTRGVPDTAEFPLIIFDTGRSLRKTSADELDLSSYTYEVNDAETDRYMDPTKFSKNDNEYEQWLKNQLRRK